MRLILDVETKDDAVLALRALIRAVEAPLVSDVPDWRRRPGGLCGIRIDGRIWAVRTTRTGYSVRGS